MIETFLRPVRWNELAPAAAELFRGFRSAQGEEMILERNMMIEVNLARNVMRPVSRRPTSPCTARRIQPRRRACRCCLDARVPARRRAGGCRRDRSPLWRMDGFDTRTSQSCDGGREWFGAGLAGDGSLGGGAVREHRRDLDRPSQPSSARGSTRADRGRDLRVAMNRASSSSLVPSMASVRPSRR